MCGVEKPTTEFNKMSRSKDGLYHWCKSCYKKWAAEYYIRNKERLQEQHRKYHLEHLEEMRQKSREYYYSEEGAKKRKEYEEKSKEKIKEYRKENREKITEKRIERLHNDPLFRRKEQIRCNIRDAFRAKKHNKKSKTAEIVGCDLYFFKEYLLGTWGKRYGKAWQGEPYQFHHIVPLSTAKTIEDVERLNHYTNIELVSPEDHMEEHSKKKRL